MKKLSFLLQGSYSALCLLDIAICLVYQATYHTEIGNLCAAVALPLTCILFFAPAMPLSLILNIRAVFRQNKQAKHTFWMIWTIVSPILYIVFFLCTVCVFVGITGGI